MSWLDQKERFEKEAKEFDKTIILLTKDNWISKAIAAILFYLSFGKFKKEEYLQKFATTLGNYHFYPKEWTIQQVELTLIHESRHTYQFRKFGFGIHPLVGLPFAAIIYLFLLFPIGLAFGRVLMEIDADIYKWKYLIKKEYPIKYIQRMLDYRVKSVAGVGYLYPLPKKLVEKLYKYFYNKKIGKEI